MRHVNCEGGDDRNFMMSAVTGCPSRRAAAHAAPRSKIQNQFSEIGEVKMKKWFGMILICGLAAFAGTPAGLHAEEETSNNEPSAVEATRPVESASAATEDAVQKSLAELSTNYASLKVTADTLWVLITGMLVFFMNLGFACVESGMCRAKNCVNILSKNFIVFAVTSVAFWFLGWGLMFGDGNGWVGEKGLLMVSGADNSPAIWNADTALNKYQGDYSG